MRSAALAIGWEFWNRHAWPLIAMGVFLLALAIFRLLMFVPGVPITVIPPDGRAAVVIAPLAWAFFYYLAVFSFGLSGDLGARQSIFPARMFTLPVKTAALVGWPMLYGTTTVAALVLAASLLARWPWGIEVPLVGPPLFAATFLAWTQALMWMPYGLPAVRPLVAVLWLVVFDTAVLLAVHYHVSEPVMLAFLAPQLPVAYLTACYGVARARRGDVPDWRPRFLGTTAVAGPASPGRSSFGSPASAQFWFEWRRQGRTLPVLVALVLPVELALLWMAGDSPMVLLDILLITLATPPLIATVAAASVSRANAHGRDAFAMSPFIATRPLSSAALIGAKLKMAAWSTVAAWLLVLIAAPLALRWSGTWPMVQDRAHRLGDLVGMPRTIALALLVLAGLMASTWKQLVQSLFIGLTGREWIARATLIGVLLFIVVIGPVVQYVVDHNSARAALWNALPATFAVLVAGKMFAAAWVAARLTRSGLVSDRTLVVGAATWVTAVFALYGLLAWLVSGPLVPQYFLVLLAILGVPLARISAAPLALSWNRHR